MSLLLIKTKKQGFTLLEIIVWMSIFLVLTTTIVLNLHQGNIRESIRQSAYVAESALRQAQTMSTAGAVLPDGSGFPAGGYGVFFDFGDKDHVIIFADMDEDYLYTAGDMDIEFVDLPGPSEFINTTEDLSVIFGVEGDVFINGDSSPTVKDIYFMAGDISFKSTVRINTITSRVSSQ